MSNSQPSDLVPVKPKKPTSAELARAVQTVATNLQGLGTYTQGIARVTANHAEALTHLNNQAHLQQGRLNEVWHEQKRLETVQEQLFVSQQTQIVQTTTLSQNQRIQEAQIEVLEGRCQQLQRLVKTQSEQIAALQDQRFNLTHALAIAFAIGAVGLLLCILTVANRQPKTSYVPASYPSAHA